MENWAKKKKTKQSCIQYMYISTEDSNIGTMLLPYWLFRHDVDITVSTYLNKYILFLHIGLAYGTNQPIIMCEIGNYNRIENKQKRKYAIRISFTGQTVAKISTSSVQVKFSNFECAIHVRSYQDIIDSVECCCSHHKSIYHNNHVKWNAKVELR